MTLLLDHQNWWKNDLSTSEGTQFDSLTTSYGLSQIISGPTHTLPNSSFCIDLIFTNQPNLVTECGAHTSLQPKCHHQIVFAKLNLRAEYSPLYERLIWDYKNKKIFHQIIVQLLFLTGVFHLKVKMFINKSTSLTKQS